MTQQGIKVLTDIYSLVRQDFHEAFPGMNENDSEREFLFMVLLATKRRLSLTTVQCSPIMDDIHRIR